jgi:flagellar basal body-associated protein FliL
MNKTGIVLITFGIGAFLLWMIAKQNAAQAQSATAGQPTNALPALLYSLGNLGVAAINSSQNFTPIAEVSPTSSDDSTFTPMATQDLSSSVTDAYNSDATDASGFG